MISPLNGRVQSRQFSYGVKVIVGMLQPHSFSPRGYELSSKVRHEPTADESCNYTVHLRGTCVRANGSTIWICVTNASWGWNILSPCKSKIARFTSRTSTINPSETRHCLLHCNPASLYRPRIAQKWFARAREEARGMHNPWRRLSGAASSSRHSLQLLDKRPRC